MAESKTPDSVRETLTSQGKVPLKSPRDSDVEKLKTQGK